MEIAPGLHRIEAPLGDRFVALYLLEGEETSLLFDTGVDSSIGKAMLPYLRRSGRDPASIGWAVISHADFDHFGGNQSLREISPAARPACHELDRLMIEDVERLIQDRYGEFASQHGIADSDETKDAVRAGTRTAAVQVTLSGGEQVRLGPSRRVEVLHTPGHSHGHLSIWDPDNRALLISDAILWSTLCTRDGKPAFPPTYRYVDAYLATIERAARDRRPELLLTAHFPVYAAREVDEFLDESKAFAERLDSALRRQLAGTSAAVPTRGLVETLAPQLGDWSETAQLALVYPLLGHLERLERYQLVERKLLDGTAHWAWR